MSKYQIVENLLSNTMNDIKSSRDKWISFLHTSSKMYKYKFKEQVLIHAQRPDATACASMNVWNKAMHCYVNKGASGIAIIDDAHERKLKYVFDISNVTATPKYGKYPKLWELREDYYEDVLTSLENTYGSTIKENSFEDRILEISLRIAEEYTEELLPDFKDFFLETSLAEMKENDLFWILCETLSESIAYATLLRCGIDEEKFNNNFKFSHLNRIDNVEAFSYIGESCSRITQPILSEIGKTVFKCEERLEKTTNKEYNALKRESDNRRVVSEDDFIVGKESNSNEWYIYDGIQNKKIIYGTSEETAKEYISEMVKNNRIMNKEELGNEFRIRKGGGLLLSENVNERTARGTFDEVRIDEKDISAGTQTSSVRSDDNGRKIENSLLGGTESSRREDGSISESDGKERERERETESEQSDVVGADDEQYYSLSRRDSSERDSLQLEDYEEKYEADRENVSAFSMAEPQDQEFYQMTLFPTQSEQLGDIVVDTAAKKESPKLGYELPSDALKRILSSGAGTRDNKIRIYRKFQMERDIDAIPSYLMKEYGTLGKGFDIDGHSISVLFDENGLSVGYGNSAKENVLVTYTWKEIAREIYSLIYNGDYLSADEIDSVEDIELGRISNLLYFLYRDGLERKPFEGVFVTNAPNSIENIKVLLQNEENRHAMLKDLEKTLEQVEAGEVKVRFYGKSRLVELIEDVKSFDIEKIEFEKKDYVNVLSPSFITQDELDGIFKAGSQIADSKYTIQAFFENNSDSKEQADFLKDEYGIGGSSIAYGISGERFDSWHDSKGLKLTSDVNIGGNIEILLSWNNVAKRIRTLVEKNEYLSEEEFVKYEQYKERKLQKKIMDEVSSENSKGEENVPNFGTSQMEADSITYDEELREAWDLLDEYTRFEFSTEEGLESLEELKEKSELNKIYVAYNETQDEHRFPIEVYVDLEEYKICQFIDGELLDENKYNSLRELIDNELKFCDFDAFVSFDVAAYEKILPTLLEKRKESVIEVVSMPQDAVARANYESLLALAPGIIDGTEEYVRFESEPFMPLTIEIIGENRIAMAHYFKQNGDLMADPDMEFEIDRENKCLYARTYQLDSLARYESVESESGIDKELESELNQFAKKWFKNIKQQGFEIVKEIENDVPNFGTEENTNKEEPEVAFQYVLQSKNNDTVYPVYRLLKGAATEDALDKILESSKKVLSTYSLVDNRDLKEVSPKNLIPFDENTHKVKPVILYTDAYINKNLYDKCIQLDADFYCPDWRRSGSFDSETILYYIDEHERLHRPTPQKSENYVIEDKEHGFGTPKEKYKWNIEAIKTLYMLEDENRDATMEEQDILAKYVGWGGLADAFDNSKSSWSSEYEELKELLSKEEYESARASTLNAHYTSPVIIEAIYKALEKFGFSRGNILEPAMGVGNFFGKLPDSMKQSKLYGVELDDISGRIARKLYPNANISICGFEDTDFDNAFFDVAIGNVPFGQYSVSDKKYDKHKFLIHDYFFAKSLDLVREGGIIAFVTSKGTLDKQNPMVRKYLSQRAELIGAIRLPNTAFKGNAGTEVTSDIIFLKKRDRVIDIEEDWVHLDKNEDDISMNSYFVEHPEMVLGKMKMVSGPYGMESTCSEDSSVSLEESLSNAISNLSAEISYNEEFEEFGEESTEKVIPASADVKNFSFAEINGKIYFRENSKMFLSELSDKNIVRVKGMIAIRDCTYELINMQLEEYSDEEISLKREELNKLYDDYVKAQGYLSSRTNKTAFSSDSSYNLLCSLEKMNENGEVVGKADMFYKRTIKKREVKTHVDTPTEALAISLGEKAKIDLSYMSSLCNKDIDSITDELKGIIFRNPITEEWEPADEYLSGNVREKLKIATDYAKNDESYESNVIALKNVQPKDLDASEIDVRLGTTWIDVDYINEFMEELFETPKYMINGKYVGVYFSEATGEWNVKGKSVDNSNTLASMTYGTKRANGYRILEDTLNLRDVKVYDIVVEDGKEKRVLNRKETMLACQKQDLIKEKFKEWIYAEPVRRQAIVEKYNTLFNSYRPREFDGSHLTFEGMSPDITLKPHQLNAVARQLYGGNTLLAHCVGAGKTFEICAAAMEKKRLGLCQKNLIVVPNHLTEQWASEFLTLYPGANILAATKKDFEPANRKRFCSRIATGDYDAIIIGHSQFEKIPLSIERQISAIENQINEVTTSILDLKANRGENYSIKQLEKTRKTLERRLKALNDAEKKDNVVTFEQLGVDSLFVDESHTYKNLFLFTKMRNVSGVAQTEAKRSSDMYAKCQYIDEITDGKGITFATGTPISNSMTELYTNMRYLQSDTLRRLNLSHFDSWAATFGETQTALELAPEGTGFRTKTRFAKFYNLPELIALFKEVADVQTSDMLKLPIPEAEYENIVLKPSGLQKDLVSDLGERAEAIRASAVPAYVDNMLKVTNDGRKLALDQRLIDEEYPENDNSKVNACVERAFEIWEDTKEQKSAQLIFCDLSTPKQDGSFSVYSDLKEKLIQKGVPEKEVAFIHDANTDNQKAELFAKVRSGQVRFLIGSTSKMGAGTNVQDRLIALHHLDVPWRPSDIEQQEGRILRQGNQNEKVKIFRYVTENTFDSYSWQLIENKQKFIGQIMTSKSPVRSCDDVDATALSYAEVKTLATGNPYIKEKMELDMAVSKLRLLKANHNSQIYKHQDNITQHYPRKIAYLKEKIEGYKHDVAIYQANKHVPDNFSMTIQGVTYTERKDAGAKIIELARLESRSSGIFTKLGMYQGLELSCGYDKESFNYVMRIKGELTHDIEMGHDEVGNITRLNNAYDSLQKLQEHLEQELVQTERQLQIAIEEVDKPFPQEDELNEKLERLSEVNALLNMDDKGPAVIDDIDEELDDESIGEPNEQSFNEEPVVKEQVRYKI